MKSINDIAAEKAPKFMLAGLVVTEFYDF